MRKIIIALFFSVPLAAQVSNPSIISVTVAPTGACTAGLPNQQVVTTGVQYSCQAGTWGAIGSGSSVSLTTNNTSGPSTLVGSVLNIPVYSSAYTGTQIFSASSFAGTTGFTVNGATVSASGGKLNFSGGAGTYTQTLDYNQTTLLPLWQMCGTITIGSASDILGFGIRSNQVGGGYYSFDANYLQTTGKVNVVSISGTTGTVQATSSGTLTASVGNVIGMCVSRNYNQFTVTANNITTQSAQISASFTYSFVYVQSALVPNAGTFSIYSLGGTPSLNSLTINSAVTKNIQVAILGDSKSAGYYAGTWGATFPTLIESKFSEVRLAGGSDQTGDMINELPEALSLTPQYVIIDTYRNDAGVCSNTAPSATTTNLTNAYNQVVAAGAKAYFLIGMWEPSGTCNQTAIWSWITTNYPNNYIDAAMVNYSATPSTILAGDNTHPNAFGHSLIASAIISKLSAVNTPSNYQTYSAYGLQNGALNISTLAASTYIDVGNNTNVNAILTVGTCANGPSIPGAVCNNQAKTGGSNVGTLGLYTNDSSTPNTLQFFYTGNATAASRKWQMQTQESGSANTGILDLQPFGGQINFGQYIVPDLLYTAAGTAIPACGSATKGAMAVVGDATVNTPGSAYTSGGTYTIHVECTFNSTGSVYAWQIM